MLRLLLVLNVTLSGILGSFLVPFYGLCVYLWFAYIRAQEWARNVGWFNALRPSLLLALCVIAGCIIHRKKMFRLNFQSILILMFWLWFTICHFNSINKVTSGFWFDFFNKLMMSGCLILGLVNTKEKFKYIFIPFIFSLGFYSSKSGLFGIIHPGAKILQGPGGMLTDNNCLALAFNMVIPFLFFAARLFEMRMIKLGLLFLYYLSIFGVVFTYSRGGFLGLCVVILLLQIKAKRNIFLLLCGSAILGSIIFVSLPDSYIERISTITTSEEGRDKSSSSRLHFWKVAFIMANDNPVFGVGPGCDEVAYNKYDFANGKFGYNRAAHSTYLQILTNLGYPGLFLFLSLIFFNVWTCRRLVKRVRGRRDLKWVEYIAHAFEISTFAFCVSGTFLSMGYADLIYHLSFLIIALNKTTKKYLKNPVVICTKHINSEYTDSLQNHRCNVVENDNLSKQEVQSAKSFVYLLQDIVSTDWKFLDKKDFREGATVIFLIDEAQQHLYNEEQLQQFVDQQEVLLLSSLVAVPQNLNDYHSIVIELDAIVTHQDLLHFIDLQKRLQSQSIPLVCYQNAKIEDKEVAIFLLNENDLYEDDPWSILREN